MNQRLETTKTLTYKAGALIKELLKQDLKVEAKSAKDWVTNIDKETEKFLVESIQQAFPNSSFLTEEDTVTFDEHDEMWIIDPIDGTSNLIHQREYFAISIAYFYKQKPVFGIVYDVMKDEMFVGESGVGAFVNDVPLQQLDGTARVGNSILLGNITRKGLFNVPLEEILDTIPTHRYLGSGALDTCRVANDQASSYVFPKIKIWDIAASLIILKEVGGTWLLGDKVNGFIFDKQSYPYLACSNEAVLKKLMSWM